MSRSTVGCTTCPSKRGAFPDCSGLRDAVARLGFQRGLDKTALTV